MEPKSMNQRIREFKEQATRTAMWIGDPDAGELDAEKFAELIVRECIDIVEGEDDGSADTKSVRLAMIRMKQHFGVAE
jgi:hypothetical protein